MVLGLLELLGATVATAPMVFPEANKLEKREVEHNVAYPMICYIVV